MYNPSLFREERPEILHEFLRANPLAALVTSDLQASHLPTFFDVEHGMLRAHMARANPHWQALGNAKVLAIFSGDEHYISPSWYPSKAEHGKVVPTWNYVAVHVTGTCTVHDDGAWLLSHLNELTQRNEAAVHSDWKVSDAPAEYVRSLAKTIIGIEIAIEGIEGKWKVSQNRSAEDQRGAMEGLETLGSPESLAMAKMMRKRG